MTAGISIIVDRLPHLEESRVFEPVAYHETLVRQVFEARRAWRAGDLEAALVMVDGALDRRPDIGLLLHERATILQALGRLREAQAVLSTAATVAPVHPVILGEVITVSFMLGDPEAARGPSEALAALTETGQVDRPGRDAATAAPAGHACPAPDEPPSDPDGGRGSVLGSSGAVDPDIVSWDVIGRDSPPVSEMTGGLESDPDERAVELRREEHMIIALAAVAAERAAELQEKERTIVALAATAEERLGLIWHLHAEAARARLAGAGGQRHEEVLERLAAPLRQEALDRLAIRLRQQERVIADLRAVADERLRRIEQFAVEYTALSEACKRLTRRQPPKRRTITGLAAAVRSKLARMLTRSPTGRIGLSPSSR
jgi:tetratricopeptide (TPR) repeat protein